MSDAFNESAVLFESASLGSLRGVTYDSSGAEIKVSDASDNSAPHEYECGKPDDSVEIRFVGTGPAPGVGSKGSLSISWNDGTSDDLGEVVVVKKGKSGDMDGEITSTLSVRPTPE